MLRLDLHSDFGRMCILLYCDVPGYELEDLFYITEKNESKIEITEESSTGTAVKLLLHFPLYFVPCIFEPC